MPQPSRAAGGESVSRSPTLTQLPDPAKRAAEATSPAAGVRGSPMGTRVVPLVAGAIIEPGDIVAYEFVSADRSWRWALGTVVEGVGPLRARAAAQKVNGATAVSTRADGSFETDSYLLVTVKDWALSRHGSQQRRILQRHPGQQPATSPPKAGGAPAAGAQPGSQPRNRATAGVDEKPASSSATPTKSKAADAVPPTHQAKSASMGVLVVAVDDPAKVERIAKARTFVLMAFDGLMDTAYFEWEEILRHNHDTVPAITRLCLRALLSYVGLLPRPPENKAGVPPKAAEPAKGAKKATGAPDASAEEWSAISVALQSMDLSDRLRGFFLESVAANGRPTTPARDSSMASTSGTTFATLNEEQRRAHAYVRASVLDNPSFEYGSAVAAGALVVRLFKCVESIGMYCDALETIGAADKRSGAHGPAASTAGGPPSSHPQAPQSGENAGISLLSFQEGASHTTTTMMSVFCRLEGDCELHGDIVLTGADVAAISTAAHGERAPRTRLDATVDEPGGARRAAILAAEEAARARIVADSTSRLLDLQAVHNECVEAWLGSALALAEQGRRLGGAAHNHAGPSTERKRISCDEGYFLTRTHQYAESLEQIRFQLRKRDAMVTDAADRLQSALNATLENAATAPPAERLSELTEALERAVDDLTGLAVQQHPMRSTPLPCELRSELMKRFASIPRAASTSPAHERGTSVERQRDGVREVSQMVGRQLPFDGDAGTPAASAPYHYYDEDEDDEIPPPHKSEERPAHSRSPATTPRRLVHSCSPAGTPRRLAYSRSHEDAAEAERQEKEIVRLTALLRATRAEREVAERRAVEMERQLECVRAASCGSTEAAAMARADSSGGPGASSHGMAASATEEVGDGDIIDLSREIRATFDRLRQRAETATEGAASVVAILKDQVERLQESAEDTSATAETRARVAKRLGVLREQQAFAEAELASHMDMQIDLHTIKKAVQRLTGIARFHDERWPLPHAREGLVTSDHVKVLSGAMWEACIEKHRCRAHEAAVRDVASALHIPDSAVVRMLVEPSATGLLLSFSVEHEASLSERAREHRLGQFPFQSLMDIYTRRDSPPQGSDALLNEVQALKERLAQLDRSAV